MRFWVHAALASTALAGISTVAQAEREPVILEPSSQWNVNFAPTKCRLTRTFGEGENLHILIVEQHNPGSFSGVTLGGPSLRRFRSRTRTWLTVNDEREKLRTEPLTGDIEKVGPALIYANLNLALGDSYEEIENSHFVQLDTEFAGSVDYVAVQQRGRQIRFATGPLAEAFKVMNSCTQDMLRDWGLNVEKHLTATRMPVWKNESAITRRIQAVYPFASRSKGVQEVVRMRVIVDENGDVESCEVEAATDGGLESPACRPMMDAKFEPALDANGQPIRSFFASSITYVLN